MVDVVLNQMIHRLTACLRAIHQSARRWRGRRGQSMREKIYANTPSGFQEKPRYMGDWLEMEGKWMGGEGDCRDVT